MPYGEVWVQFMQAIRNDLPVTAVVFSFKT